MLVNNAGGALGLESVAEADEEKWLQMYESNVMGTMRMTKALLPRLAASGDGHVVSVTSIAAIETYRGGAGYNAAKHAQRAMLRVLRLEHARASRCASPRSRRAWSRPSSRWSASAATRRRRGGSTRACSRCSAEDVAECIRWALAQPPHVNVDEIVVRPRDQATAADVHRQVQ